MTRSCSPASLLARIERWLEQEGVFHIAGFGDVTLAAELAWEPGVGLVYLRRIADGQLWRADVSITARPAEPGEPGTNWQDPSRSLWPAETGHPRGGS